MHIDADSFFASVESAKNPGLRGKPVVTGRERGIATSMSKEAKALGITRGMPIYQIKKYFPEVIVVSSDYEAYAMYSSRMFDVVRRYTDVVEEYSIDECFADLTNCRKINKMTYKEILKRIQDEIGKELNISVSLGCAPTKVLAKVGSKWGKPHGITMIPEYLAHQYLLKLPIDQIWGIGPASSTLLIGKGIKTAYDFAIFPKEKLCTFVHAPLIAIWHELNCHQALFLDINEEKGLPKSISRTLSFSYKPSKEELFAELTRNVENACISCRHDKIAPKSITWFLKTSEFKFQNYDIKLEKPTNIPTIILDMMWEQFKNIDIEGLKYRATGVTFSNLVQNRNFQNDLFKENEKVVEQESLFKVVDDLGYKYGRHIIQLASGVKTHSENIPFQENGRIQSDFFDKIKKTGKELYIPYLGETI